MGLERKLGSVLLPLPGLCSAKSFVRTAVNLSYRVMGEGSTEEDEPPLLILHGLLSCKADWKGIGKTIINMTKRSVVIADLRNHARSPRASSQTYEDMAEDVVQLLDKLKVDEVSLLGHDIGGRTAMAVSLNTPSRVAGLLVVDVSPVSTPPEFLAMHKLLTILSDLKFTKKKLYEARKEAKKKLRKNVPDDATLYSLLSNIRSQEEGFILNHNVDVLIEQFQYLASFPVSMIGKSYAGPCLFIGGQLSEYIPPDDLPKIRELFPQAVVTYVKQTKHNLHKEDTKSFLELVMAFLKSNHYR